VSGEDGRRGYTPRALASDDRERVAIYLPAGGSVTVAPEAFPSNARWRWIDPRTGEDSLAVPVRSRTFVAPAGDDADDHIHSYPADWLLVLE
jgi:hypothetical protein